MVSSSPSASSGLERDKFDNKTVSFEEHIKFEHNMWNYLYFIVLVRVKNKTDYTGPESYVAQMIKVWTPPGSSGHQGRGGGADSREPLWEGQLRSSWGQPSPGPRQLPMLPTEGPRALLHGLCCQGKAHNKPVSPKGRAWCPRARGCPIPRRWGSRQTLSRDCCLGDHSEGAFSSSARGRAASRSLDGPGREGAWKNFQLSDFGGIKVTPSNFCSD